MPLPETLSSPGSVCKRRAVPPSRPIFTMVARFVPAFCSTHHTPSLDVPSPVAVLNELVPNVAKNFNVVPSFLTSRAPSPGGGSEYFGPPPPSRQPYTSPLPPPETST